MTPTAPRTDSNARPRRDHGSDALTKGIRVVVRPRYLPEQSNPAERQFLFAYRITIRNEGDEPATLLRRHWVVVDADGESHEVHGDGVIGQRPRLEPGGQFEYSSHCPLPT